MKAIAPVGAAKRRPIGGEQIGMPGLSGGPFGGEYRMAEAKSPQNSLRIDARLAVQCQAENVPRTNALQHVQVVGHARRRSRASA